MRTTEGYSIIPVLYIPVSLCARRLAVPLFLRERARACDSLGLCVRVHTAGWAWVYYVRYDNKKCLLRIL